MYRKDITFYSVIIVMKIILESDTFPLLVKNLLCEYYWKMIYKNEVTIHIINPNNRRLRTLRALIDCRWRDNFGYKWKLLYFYIHSVFIPFGEWIKYKNTLNKTQERVINITEEGFTQFPINPQLDTENSTILPEYYKY